MKAVITVLGYDKVGIIATVTGVLEKYNVNILDISQTIMQEIFTMIMISDISKINCEFNEFSKELETQGQKMGVKIRVQRDDIFKAMHRI